MADFFVRLMDILLRIVNIMSEDLVWLKDYFQTSSGWEWLQLFLSISICIIVINLSLFLLRLLLRLAHYILNFGIYDIYILLLGFEVKIIEKPNINVVEKLLFLLLRMLILISKILEFLMFGVLGKLAVKGLNVFLRSRYTYCKGYDDGYKAVVETASRGKKQEAKSFWGGLADVVKRFF